MALLSGSATWTWASVVLMVLLLIRWVGDRWWGVTVLLFLPRWLFLTPLAVLAPGSGLSGRGKDWALQGAVALVVAGPLMLVSLPFPRLWERPPSGTRVRIMTYNRGQNPLDAGRLIRCIEEGRVDLICFQEGNLRRNPRLDAYFAARGWYRDRGQYVASRYPIVAELPPLAPDIPKGVYAPLTLVRLRIRAAPGVEFGLATVHMPTLRFGLYRFLGQDVEGLKRHIAGWDWQMGRLLVGLAEMRDVPILVGGDFNVPPDHPAMAALGSSYRLAFEEAGWGYGYTRPARYPWFRIDHILASPEWAFTRCRVGPDCGSDHLPLIAEAVLPASATPPPEATRRLSSDRE
jgi:endonuclease/exonuclease/phosphatase (EEP) superfamily protein YafD